MTLDLMRLAIEGLGGHVKRTVVTRLEEDTYYAEIIIETPSRVLSVDARPSDSVGLALRSGAPIFVSEDVMQKAGQVVSPDDEQRITELRGKLREIQPEDFGNFRM